MLATDAFAGQAAPGGRRHLRVHETTELREPSLELRDVVDAPQGHATARGGELLRVQKADAGVPTVALPASERTARAHPSSRGRPSVQSLGVRLDVVSPLQPSHDRLPATRAMASRRAAGHGRPKQVCSVGAKIRDARPSQPAKHARVPATSSPPRHSDSDQRGAETSAIAWMRGK